MDNINAEIVSIGTEILLGELTDTNSVFIARILRDLGINVYYMTSVGDNESRIEIAIKQALSRAEVVITCGGLGPTIDDMTRQSIANTTGRELIFHQELFNQIAERFASFKVEMTENNSRQAYLPAGAIAIENPVGTAPAFIVEHNQKAVISLPGVPREMKYLMNTEITSYLRSRYDLGVIKAKIFKTAGIGESALDDLLGTDLLEQSNPSIGLAAHSGQIDIRVTAKSENENTADLLIQKMAHEIRNRAEGFIFGEDDDSLESVVIGLIRNVGAPLIIAEIGTGPIIASTLGKYTLPARLIVSHLYENAKDLTSKVSLSEESDLRKLSNQFAKQLYAERESATAAIVVISDPDIDEGKDREESTVVTVYTPEAIRQRGYGFGARSPISRDWIKSWALASLWRMLNAQRQ